MVLAAVATHSVAGLFLFSRLAWANVPARTDSAHDSVWGVPWGWSITGDRDRSPRATAEEIVLTHFLLRFWDVTLSTWAPLQNATLGVDYTLAYQTTGELSGYTLLTVGRVGDFDNDGDVDGRDFLAWQRHPSQGSLDDWQAAYGASSTLAADATTVPEPTSWLLSLVVTAGFLAVRYEA